MCSHQVSKVNVLFFPSVPEANVTFFFQLLGTKGRTEVSEAHVFFLVVAGVSAQYAVGRFTPEVRTSVKRDLMCREKRLTINGAPESPKAWLRNCVSATVVRFVGERGGDLGGERGRRGAALSIGIGEPLTLP